MAAKHLDDACLGEEVQQHAYRCRATVEFIPEPYHDIGGKRLTGGDNAPYRGRMPPSHMGSER